MRFSGHPCWIWLSGLVFLLLVTGCRGPTVSLLAINDVYRIEGVDAGRFGGLARVRTIREELAKDNPSLILFLAGDFLGPSLLSRRYKGQHMIDVLNQLDGKDTFDSRFFVTFGNHEFDKSRLSDAQMLSDRIKESDFTWLGSNIDFVEMIGTEPYLDNVPLKDSVLIDANELKIGIFSITTRIKHPEYISAFNDYGETAEKFTKILRQSGADIVIALTHLSVKEDIAILNELRDNGPDLIIGGHEHHRLSQWSDDEKRVVIKADAEARSAALVELSLDSKGNVDTTFEYLELDPSVPKDNEVNNLVESWLARNDQDACLGTDEAAGCMKTPLVKTDTELIAEELEIRRFETNFGNWILDTARSAFADENAQIAIMNAGGLRLNQNIPAGQYITRGHIEELIAYPTTLRLVQITGKTLREIINHSIEDWTGNGWFLQISGMSYVHDSENQTVSELRLENGRLIEDSMKLRMVVNDFLLNRRFDQDGYRMIGPENLISDKQVDLVKLVLERFRNTGTIEPVVDGRICNIRLRPRLCRRSDLN